MKKIIFFFVFTINCFLSNCSFQISLFTELNREYGGKNLIISPLSVFHILSLTTNGANADTQQEMIDALQCIDLTDLNDINMKLVEIMEHFVSVEKANAIMTRFKPEESFYELSEKYQSPVIQLISTDQVNKWCSSKTHGNITEIIKELSPNTMMLLLNAIYFRGEWLEPFDPKKTTTKPFFNFDSEETAVKVEFMTRSLRRHYFENDYIQAVELPYKKDSMSAIIILPKEGYEVNDFINSLTLNDDFIKEIIDNFKSIKVNLDLPKFGLSFFASLKKALINMGIQLAFSPEADLTGLILDAKDLGLYIEDVLHKTYLRVDEFGTEAAGVTIVDVETKSIEETVKMEVNRPFVMIIRSEDLPENHDILFISKIEEIN